MNATALAFELDDPIVKRPFPVVAHPVVEAGEDSVTGVAGIVLWGELLDRLGLVGECDRRSLRPIGPGGYTGGSAAGPWWRPSWQEGTSCRTAACWRRRPPSAFAAGGWAQGGRALRRCGP